MVQKLRLCSVKIYLLIYVFIKTSHLEFLSQKKKKKKKKKKVHKQKKKK
jgi:hypothetical protein